MNINFSITEILVLLSLFMVAPAMFVLIWAALNGALSRSERARFLPLRHPEKDYWDAGDRHRVGGGGEP